MSRCKDWRVEHQQVKKFDSIAEAIASGYTVLLGDGYFGQGGMEMKADCYPELFDVLKRNSHKSV